MADLADIPDEAVTAAARALNLQASDGLDEWDDLLTKEQRRFVNDARRALAAALPVLNTARDAKAAEPNLIMGNRPDGSPWVISAEFAGATVRVDSVGVLRLHGKAVAPWEAHRIAKGLLAAITWLENDGAAKAETAGQAAAFACPGRSMPQPADAPPEGYVACYRAGHECTSTTTNTEDGHGGLSTRTFCPCCGDGHGSSYIPASLRGVQ